MTEGLIDDAKPRRKYAFLEIGIPLLFVLLLILGASTVLAHGGLRSAKPAPGETVTSPPEEVLLTFTEPVSEGTILLVTLEGESIPTTMLEGEADDQLRASIDVEISPGEYSVVWAMTSVDGHLVNGSYNFVYAPNNSDDESQEGFTWFTYVWGFAFFVLTVGGWLWFRRSILRRGFTRMTFNDSWQLVASLIFKEAK